MANMIVANARRPKARRGRAMPVGPGGSFAKGRGALGLSGGGSRATSRRTQVIEEDEYIGEVSGSVGFATTAYPLNPGQSGTFPWGNKIAQLYEKYDFEFVEFYYKREVSEYASNGQTGKVILSFDYDASDNAPTSKQQVEDTVPHVDGMPCTPQIRLPIDCACIRNGPARYVRPGAQPASTDIKTYDAGNLYVSTYGCAGTTVVGELRVKYRCRFSEPVLETAGSAGIVGASFIVTSAAVGETAGLSTFASPLFTPATNPQIVTNGIGASISSLGVITLPAGRYVVQAGNLSTDTSAAITAETLTLQQSGAGGVFYTGVTAVTSGGLTQGHNGWVGYITNAVWDTYSMGVTLELAAALTYASGTCINMGWLQITMLGATSALDALPPSRCETSSVDSNRLLLARLSRLERLLEKDSEFEEEDEQLGSSSVKATPSSSAASTSLSRSTLDAIGELITRKSTKQQ